MDLSLPSIEISGKIAEDSAFSVGRSMIVFRWPAFRSAKLPLSPKTQEILRHLSIGAALTTNSLVRITGKHRPGMNKDLLRLWQAGLVKQLAIATDHTVFKLWTTADRKPPATAQEACRMAVLGAFYALAARETPDFGWRLIRDSRYMVVGEMSFTGRNGREKWLIDAPRRGEIMIDNAQAYVFPTLEEARAAVPPGTPFTSDICLFKGGRSLKDMLFEHE